MTEFGRNTDKIKADADLRVDEERTVRLFAGTDVEIPGYGWVKLQGRPMDQDALMGLAVAAQLRMATGDMLTTTTFIARDNTLHELTPPQIVQVFVLGSQYVSACHIAARWIKDNEAVTADPAASTAWPAPGISP